MGVGGGGRFGRRDACVGTPNPVTAPYDPVTAPYDPVTAPPIRQKWKAFSTRVRLGVYTAPNPPRELRRGCLVAPLGPLAPPIRHEMADAVTRDGLGGAPGLAQAVAEG
jgi:hypothetical protein